MYFAIKLTDSMILKFIKAYVVKKIICKDKQEYWTCSCSKINNCKAINFCPTCGQAKAFKEIENTRYILRNNWSLLKDDETVYNKLLTVKDLNNEYLEFIYCFKYKLISLRKNVRLFIFKYYNDSVNALDIYNDAHEAQEFKNANQKMLLAHKFELFVDDQ